jgi:hypothetical protein
MKRNKKSFLIYHSWESAIDLMTDEELRNFIKNLFRADRGEDPVFNSRVEQLHWSGISIVMESNLKKWDELSERNKINGAQGGRPNYNSNK